jgi:PIN domain nuclease of toxin-antitoxin system
VTVLDSSAIIGMFLGEPCMDQVATLLASPDDGICTVSAIGLGEIVDILVRVERSRVPAVDEALELLLSGGLDVAPVDAETGRLAGLLRARHWNRDRRPISLADAAILATAMIRVEPLATTDVVLAAVARSEGHPVIALPDSTGRIPA